MTSNAQIDLAWKFLEQTGTNIFLTGRAGTGKTTFLRNLKECSTKRMIVVAPTGVAAINAAGVTIHSFFQLPFGPYLPSMQGGEEGSRLKMNFSREKISIIRSLDLLVIDEISMVRADLLDAINDVLQRYRDHSKPFGGVQLLMIGDLQQLSPVVVPQEWNLIRQHYNSPYFFDSKALRSTNYLTLELRHIYRQSDGEFIDILNRVRENKVDRATLDKLNSRYIPHFEPSQQEGYITLTSHNNVAREINEHKLDQLDSPSYTFECQIEGVFPEYLYPNDGKLTLKKGAQVMFLKNDTSGQHRYFNGKIGQVTDLNESLVEVTIDTMDEPIKVELAEWTNAKYVIDPQTKEITEAIDGVFRQFPLKAAWAITIHKSQGLTFERAIIDAAGSFSHGQVYVALSRCRTFEGLVLRTPLQGSAIINDSTVEAYTKSAQQNQPDQNVLRTHSRTYCQSLLIDMFDFEPMQTRIRVMQWIFNKFIDTLYPKLTQRWSEASSRFASEIFSVSEKFRSQINGIIESTEQIDTDPQLLGRITKAQSYFLAKFEEIIVPLVEQSKVELDNKETRKMLMDALRKLREVLLVKLAVLALDNKEGFVVSAYLAARAKATLEDQKPKTVKSEKPTKISADDSATDIKNAELFELLRLWRKDIAERDKIPAYMVMHQKTLITVCSMLPQSEKDLLSIKGIGKAFIARHGSQVLSIVCDWIEGRDGIHTPPSLFGEMR